MSGHDRQIIEQLLRSSNFSTFYDRIQDIAGVNLRPPTDFADVISELEKIPTILGTLSSILSEVAPTQSAESVLQADSNEIQQRLENGEDPNGGNTTSDAVGELRTAISNASSPTYGGTASDDQLGDLLKYCVDQQIS